MDDFLYQTKFYPSTEGDLWMAMYSVLIGCLVGFYDTLPIVSFLMLIPVYTYLSKIYDLEI